MKQALIIVNKKSGTKDKKDIENLVYRRIDKAVYHSELAFTQYKGHATELSRHAVQKGMDMVIAVGGDGSVNEVARALIHTDTALGILPMGSGNGLARSLGIPLALQKAFDIINKGNVKAIDIGLADQHLFLSNAGVGFDALVAKNFERSKRRGLLSYIYTIMRTLTVYKPAYYDLCIDGERKIKKAFFIGIANGNQLGYNFKIAPEAAPYDGFLDVCMIGAIPLWKMPLAAILTYNGKLPRSTFVEYMRCKKLVIQMKENIGWMQTDGDAIAIDHNKLVINIVPHALKVVVP